MFLQCSDIRDVQVRDGDKGSVFLTCDECQPTGEQQQDMRREEESEEPVRTQINPSINQSIINDQLVLMLLYQV